MNHWIFLGIAIVLNSCAHFTIKYTSLIEEINQRKIMLFMLGAGCFGVSLIFYTLALSKLKLTIAFPLSLGIGAIITTTLAVFFLNERISFLYALGLVLIIAGVYIISNK
ncbi:MAG: EamA family transporter [Spirochaetes bacterium]|nr:EamA family transporter [Spirochaetota bacterium]